ncbi:MAG: DUF29 domain-containing protein [Lamprobacter sp.]|uniref:DUF29 domain-containing protein n=1 Tax=Lamprobacter sp. TaxID=3100796 RepID=UPI002B2624AE|nr:DUF29 domain-containing protein [Lamprobacter sp.]MEA3639382.1 DUF29 domain-containing protein [Lamprobacter sp.]
MTTTGYEQDFHRWTQEQACLLRSGQYAALDIDHLAEELESMGARERRELTNRLKVLLAHLLKWQHQPERRSPSWRATIKEQRLSIGDLLDDNPSLKPTLEQQIAKAYRLGRLLAVKETNLEESQFPVDCPYSRVQVTDLAFYPN